MSASTPAGRLVTSSGIVWTLRCLTELGEGLYAPEPVSDCPRWVMATAADLAVHGVQEAPARRPAVAAGGVTAT
jgi:hypothetical protein